MLLASGLAKVSVIYCGEASFFSKESRHEVIDVIERYTGKSNAKIVLISTPNKPGDLMDQILSQPFEESFYKVLTIDYQWGINKIYSKDDIEIAYAVDRCLKLGEELEKTAYIDDWSINIKYVMSIDPGWGSSNTAIILSRFVDVEVEE